MANKFSKLREKMSPARKVRVAARTAQLLEEMPLQELRQARQYSQESLASALETSQSSISKLERRVDVYVSTLRRYIESMGGELEIIATFPDGSVRINQFEGIRAPSDAADSATARTGASDAKADTDGHGEERAAGRSWVESSGRH